MPIEVSQGLHPLYGAELRVDRAAKHIADLKNQLQEWANLHPELFEAKVDETGRVRFEPKPPVVEPLATASVMIGDALYNLRAALDYIVYAIALYNNNQEHVEGTQFPIDDDPEVFEGRVTGRRPTSGKPVRPFLRKVPPAAVDRIRDLQPFSGVKWTGDLRDLSNPDKHRTPTALSSESHFRGLVERDQGLPVGVRGDFEVQVFFQSPRVDAADTLELFEREVRSTVELFKRGFQISPSNVVD